MYKVLLLIAILLATVGARLPEKTYEFQAGAKIVADELNQNQTDYISIFTSANMDLAFESINARFYGMASTTTQKYTIAFCEFLPNTLNAFTVYDTYGVISPNATIAGIILNPPFRGTVTATSTNTGITVSTYSTSAHGIVIMCAADASARTLSAVEVTYTIPGLTNFPSSPGSVGGMSPSGYTWVDGEIIEASTMNYMFSRLLQTSFYSTTVNLGANKITLPDRDSLTFDGTQIFNGAVSNEYPIKTFITQARTLGLGKVGSGLFYLTTTSNLNIEIPLDYKITGVSIGTNVGATNTINMYIHSRDLTSGDTVTCASLVAYNGSGVGAAMTIDNAVVQDGFKVYNLKVQGGPLQYSGFISFVLQKEHNKIYE